MSDENPYSSPTPIETSDSVLLPLEDEYNRSQSFRLKQEPQWKTDRGIAIVLAIVCGLSSLAFFVDLQAQRAMVGISGVLACYFFHRSSKRIEEPY